VRNNRDATTNGGVIVANPGVIPEVLVMAIAFAGAGILRTYATPVAIGSAGIPVKVIRAIPDRFRKRIENLLKRRELPESLMTAF
jgi:hypothetical protein